MERVYLDICSLKRPFDDQRQPRVREEAMAVGAIVGRAEAGQIAALGFGALDAPYLAFAERAEAAWSVTCDEKAVEAGRLGDAFREDDPGRGDCVEERRELFGDLMLDEPSCAPGRVWADVMGARGRAIAVRSNPHPMGLVCA
jgi:hypothetical protein